LLSQYHILLSNYLIQNRTANPAFYILATFGLFYEPIGFVFTINSPVKEVKSGLYNDPFIPESLPSIASSSKTIINPPLVSPLSEFS